MNSNLLSRINPNHNDYLKFGHASNYDRNYRKTKVYIRFLRQSDAFTDDYLSSCRVNLTTFCSWLGDYSLSDIRLKSPNFHWFLYRLSLNEDQNKEILENCRGFLFWAKSMYGKEFIYLPLWWIYNISY